MALAKPLDALEDLNGATAEVMKLEVAAAGGDATTIVAMLEGVDVKFVHNLTLAKAQGDFVLIGVAGTGHVANFIVVGDTTIDGSFAPPPDE